VQTGRPSVRPTTVRLACAVVAAIVALTIAELTSDRFRAFMSDHSLISTFIAEAILLAGVYLVIDEIIERREARRWGDVTSLGLRALSPVAHRPGEIVRRMVDELAVETRRAHPASGHDGDQVSPGEPADYHELISVHADELGDWLRANKRVPGGSRRKRGRVRSGWRRRSSAGARHSSRVPTPPSCSTCFRTSSMRLAPLLRRSCRLPAGCTPSADEKRPGFQSEVGQRTIGGASRTACSRS
jgi:hypothetical protein